MNPLEPQDPLWRLLGKGREADVRHWRAQFSLAEGGGHLIVARVVNYASLRREFEQLFDR